MYQKHNIKIHKMGPKLGIYFPNKIWNENSSEKGQYIKITLIKKYKKFTFLTRLNQIISLRKSVKRNLSLGLGDIVQVKIEKITNLQRSKEIFYNSKIDMLSLVPEKTSQGYEIIVTEFTKNSEKRLRIWYCHERGSGRQIEIKRFVNIKTLGKLFGQLQAEGTKHSEKKQRLEFCNKLVLEHKDYVNYLTEIGISKEKIFSQISRRNDTTNLEKPIKEYEETVAIPVSYITRSGQKGKYGFRTYVRSILITEIFLNGLNIMRKQLVNKDWDIKLQIFADAFFSKLLTGDGTLDVMINNREYKYPFVRIKITDQKLEYLMDYAKILKKLGFNPKIKEEHIFVRAVCSLERLLYLYKIRAFENTNNWNKLLVLIALYLQGRRYRTLYRFLDLTELDSFTSLDLMKNYNLQLRAVNDWLNNKEKEGLLIGIRKRPYAIQWTLADRAKTLANILSEWKKEFDEFRESQNSTNLYDILESLKIRKTSDS